MMVGNTETVEGSKRVPAGIVDKGCEFFKTDSGQLVCTHNKQIYFWPDFPENILEIVREDITKHPEAMKALASWENLLPEDYVRRYIACRFGGIDDQPDIDKDGRVVHAEYVSCRLRGTCKYEGKLCCSLKAEFGIISPAEMAVLKLANKPIKIIADKLCIAEETVKSHLKSIKEKTGLKDKTEVAIYSYKKGLSQ